MLPNDKVKEIFAAHGGIIEIVRCRYSDRTPLAWHLTGSKDSGNSRFKIDYPFIKPYYVVPSCRSWARQIEHHLRLSEYAKKLQVMQKVKTIIGVWM